MHFYFVFLFPHFLFRFGLSETIFIFSIFHDPIVKLAKEDWMKRKNFRDNRISYCEQCLVPHNQSCFSSRCLSQLKNFEYNKIPKLSLHFPLVVEISYSFPSLDERWSRFFFFVLMLCDCRFLLIALLFK